MSPRAKRAFFLAVTLTLPLLLLLVVEGALRIFWRGGSIPLFVRAPIASGNYLVANPTVARRWFALEESPPTLIAEPFAARKPARAFRVFVLGESSTAGFPFPRNVTFARQLRDVLRDALPRDSVEVINLGIPATNSYAMLDLADEIVAQRPDAVLVYAGHNEWYGALGAGSAVTLSSRPALVRLVLALQRWRIVMAVRHAIVWVRRQRGGAATSSDVASFMETLARDREIALGGQLYRRGIAQFAGNLDRIVERLRGENVPVFLASPASNVRDQRPFASVANSAPGGADSVFAGAARLLARGDTAAARGEFARARDLDVVRFRAPTAFDSVVRAISRRHGATYVPVAEKFARASPGGIPGQELFLEHVHPTTRGYSLIARAFFEALNASRVRELDTTRVRTWAEYERDRWLTPLDTMIAMHRRNTLALRWPFVTAAGQRDYRATYRPRDYVDSLAFAVSRGESWELAKLSLAQHYERRGAIDSAIAEYRGLARDAPFFETPERLLGRALVLAGRMDEAEPHLRRALQIAPTAAAAHALALIVLRRREVPEGVRLLELAQRLEPDRPDVLYQLAVARGMAQDLNGARSVARRLAQVAPGHPGLPGLLKALGLPR